jgi:pyrimidine-nucleoside phosphorylase
LSARPAELIIKKRDGGELSREEIASFIKGYVDGSVADYQMAAMAMAIFWRGMTPAETGELTLQMMASGDTYDLSDLGRPLVDKHSTGGVGDKISLILAPLAAACGLGVPMVSGRGLGHTGGTLDKLESIPGFRIGLEFAEFKKVLQEIGVCMIGQTDNFVPADKKLYALRDVTGTVESIPLITGSILSKKFASGAQALVMDVKYGSGAFMNTREKAEALARSLSSTGEAAGRPVKCVLSDMGQPLGAAVGNTLEVLESLDLLRGSGPKDIRDLTLQLVADMIVLGKLAKTDADALALATKKLDDGSAMKIFRRMIALQSGDPTVCDGPTLGWSGRWAEDQTPKLDLAKLNAGSMKIASQKSVVQAPKSGRVESFDTRAVGLASCVVGAGRQKTTDSVDHGVGIIVHARLGDAVSQGGPLYTLYHAGKGVEEAEKMLLQATRIV